MEEEEFVKKCKETAVPQNRIDDMIEASKELRKKFKKYPIPVLDKLVKIFFDTAFQNVHYSIHSYKL
ncbi:MAG: hypothetical protein IJQ86_05450 [Spirochaetia bacterium]|nr:hypothetical protein [Spirochaetia bacterium]